MSTPGSQVVAFAIGKKEGTFKVQIPDAMMTTWIACNEVDFPQLHIRHHDDRKQINGFLGPTKRYIEHRSGSKAWKFDASIEMLAFTSIMQLGNVAPTGSGDPYTQTLKWPTICAVDPPSFSYFHGLNCPGSTGTFKIRKGVVVASQQIEVSGKAPVKHTVALMDDGSTTDTPSFTVPALTPVTEVFGNMVQVQLGPPGSLVDLSAARRLRSLKLDINSNIKDIETPNSSVLVDEYQFGDDSPVLSGDLVIQGDESSAEWGYFEGSNNVPTLAQFSILIDAGVSPLRSFKLLQTNCHVIGCQKEKSGKETHLNIKIGDLHQSTDAGPAQIISKTGQATYLIAAP